MVITKKLIKRQFLKFYYVFCWRDLDKVQGGPAMGEIQPTARPSKNIFLFDFYDINTIVDK